jgi:hypothetical protein
MWRSPVAASLGRPATWPCQTLSDTREADGLLRAIAAKLAQWEKTAEPRFRQYLDRLIQALEQLETRPPAVASVPSARR